VTVHPGQLRRWRSDEHGWVPRRVTDKTFLVLGDHTEIAHFPRTWILMDGKREHWGTELLAQCSELISDAEGLPCE